MNIFNIVKANEMISTLEAKVAALTTEQETHKANALVVEQRATQLAADLATANAKIAGHDAALLAKAGEVTAAQAKVTALETELATAKTAVTDFEGKLKEASAKEAARIVAASGTQKVEGGKTETAGGEGASKNSGLKGLAKVEAAFAEQLAGK